MKCTLFLFPLFFLALTSCKNTPGSEVSVKSKEDFHTHVEAGSPSIFPMEEMLRMNAVTTYINRENIRATTTGFIQETKIVQGDRVKRGQHVFSLKTKEAEALGAEILSDPDINITGVIHLTSKNTGIITQVFFQDGDYVVDGDVLAELTKPSSLSVKLYVPYEYTSWVKQQKRVEVQLPGGESLTGIIRQLLPSEDIVSQTTPYLVSLSPYRFLPENLNVTVLMPIKSNKDALVVPRKAIQSNEEQTRFWVMQIINDTLAVRQEVELGMRNDSLIEILNNKVKITDRIVVAGAYGLPDTAAISIVSNL